MAFTDLGSLGATGSTVNNQTSLVLTTTAAVAAGELVVLVIGSDNIANAVDDGAVNDVTNSGTAQTWIKPTGATNTVAAQAGASCAIFYCIASAALASGTTITINFFDAALTDASAVTARHFSMAAGASAEVLATARLINNTGADPGSLDATTANVAALRIRGIASQVGNNTNLTATTNWVAWANGNSATTGTTGEICARAEHRIVTGTGAASDPTYVSAIYASSYVAFGEVLAKSVVADPGSYSLGGTAATPKVARKVVAAVSSYAVTGTIADLAKSGGGGTPWTPANLTTTPRVILDGATIAWSGSNFATTTHAGSFGGNWVASTGTVVKGTQLNGYDTLSFAGAQRIGLSASNDWSGEPCIFSVVAASRSMALIAHGWNAAVDGWIYYYKINFSGTLGGHSIALDDCCLMGSGNNCLNHTYATTPSSANTNYHIGYARSGAGTGKVRQDGTDETEAGRTTTTSVNSFTLDTVYVGGASGAGEHFTGTVAYLAVLDPGVTDAEIEKLEGWAAHKYGLTANLPAGHPYKSSPPTTGPSGKILTADAGSYALTGTAASLERGRVVVAGTASYAVTGTAATLKLGLKVVAGVGSYALTGTAAALLRERKVVAGVASYALTGTTATLRRNLPLVAGTASYSLSGMAATLLLGRKVVAGTASYALSGTAATFRRTWRMVAGAGAYALTGSDVTFTKRVNKLLTADPGSYTLSGTAAGLFRGRRATAGTAGYVLTGTAAALERGRVVAAASGSYALSGTATGLLHGWKLAAGTAAYALVGTAANFKTSPRIVAGAGSYTLVGSTANLVKFLTKTLIASPGSYSLTGTAAALRVGHLPLVAVSGSYTITGTPASLERGRVVVAGTGSYALTGAAAQLRHGWKMVAGAGSYGLVGAPATLRRTRMVIAGTASYTLVGTSATLEKGTGLKGVNVWMGSAWVEKPVKVWDGAAWVQKGVKTWNGSAWV